MKGNKIFNYFKFVKILYIYIKAHLILLFHYDYKTFSGGKYERGKTYKNIDAPIWRLIIDDYHSCKNARVNLDVPWPVSSRICITGYKNISFHPDDLNNFQGFGNYYQAIGKITIGRGTYIAPNVGIITSNHDLNNLDKHLPPEDVVIGEKCWIGMNSIILPGVSLGSQTIVGAGSVVTKSFTNGNCVIAGNPARIIKNL